MEPELEERLEAHLKKLEEEKEEAKRTSSGLDRDVAVGKLSGQIVKALELKNEWKKLEIEREEKKHTLSGSEWRALLSDIADAKRNIKMVVSPNAKAKRRADQKRSAANRKAAAAAAAAAAEETALVPVRCLCFVRTEVCGPSSSCSLLTNAWRSCFALHWYRLHVVFFLVRSGCTLFLRRRLS
jgi:hypothetical protein